MNPNLLRTLISCQHSVVLDTNISIPFLPTLCYTFVWVLDKENSFNS